MKGEGMALGEKITKYPAAASEFRTHDLCVTSPTPYPLRHPDFCICLSEKRIYVCQNNTIYVICNKKKAKTNLICLML